MGKRSFEADKLKDNVEAFLEHVADASAVERPRATSSPARTFRATMSPGIELAVAT